jgi:uncharacterized membrane protein
MHVQRVGFGAGGLALPFFLFLVFLAVVVLVVLILLRQRGQHFGLRGMAQPNGQRPSSYDAMQILNERLARGEIGAEDYTARRDLLQSQT